MLQLTNPLINGLPLGTAVCLDLRVGCVATIMFGASWRVTAFYRRLPPIVFQ